LQEAELDYKQSWENLGDLVGTRRRVGTPEACSRGACACVHWARLDTVGFLSSRRSGLLFFADSPRPLTRGLSQRQKFDM
jgi:hypothetical protein